MSGPQVVEGWYGQPFGKPLARTREYVDIIRRVLRREEPVAFAGEHYRMPYDGPNSWGLGKPLRSITHPLRPDLPILLGAEGPKNVALAAEIADGWLPLYYSPFRPEVYADSLRAAKPGFEICVTVMGCAITDDVEAGLMPTKAALAFYIGGMGAKDRNFHMELMSRMGFEAEAHRIQELFFEGRRDEAIPLVPTEFADEISLVGSKERIRDRLAGVGREPGHDDRVERRPRHAARDVGARELAGRSPAGSARSRGYVRDASGYAMTAAVVGGAGEELQRRNDTVAVIGRHVPHHRVDLVPALVHHLVDESLTERGQHDHDFAPVERRRPAFDQPRDTSRLHIRVIVDA